MQYFQPILIVIGLIAIGGVLVHGYLLSRKGRDIATNTPVNVDFFAEKESLKGEVEIADDVISEVRIINEQDEQTTQDIDFSKAIDEDRSDSVAFAETTEQPVDNEIVEVEIISDEVVAQDLEITTESKELNEVVEEEVIVAETTITENAQSSEEGALSVENAAGSSEATVAENSEKDQPQDLFIFNVVAQEEGYLGGHELLQFFLTSGFRFGEMSIFHRHQYSDGTGPILFSIANMMAPGVFDPDNMEQFKSQGVSFFLTAPNKNINVKESFDMMLRAVEQMAEEFDCIVLNAEREPLTKAQFIEYNNRLLHYT